MSKDDDTEETGEEICVRALRSILKGQLNDINKLLVLISAIQKNEAIYTNVDRQVLKIVLTMTHMVGVSGETIKLLTEGKKLQIRDAFPIARSITEMTVNICYIMAVGKDIARQAENHAEQKSYNNLQINKKMGDFSYEIHWSGELRSSDEVRLKSITQDFRSKKGREKNWTDLSISDRIIEIEKTFPKTSINLACAMIIIYPNASEIVHGSYYGAMHFWQPELPNGTPNSVEELRQLVVTHQLTVLCTVVQSYFSLIDCYGAFLNVEELTNVSATRFDQFKQLIEGLNEMQLEA